MTLLGVSNQAVTVMTPFSIYYYVFVTPQNLSWHFLGCHDSPWLSWHLFQSLIMYLWHPQTCHDTFWGVMTARECHDRPKCWIGRNALRFADHYGSMNPENNSEKIKKIIKIIMENKYSSYFLFRPDFGRKSVRAGFRPELGKKIKRRQNKRCIFSPGSGRSSAGTVKINISAGLRPDFVPKNNSERK